MSNKILTSWHPAIRWILLPITCILCPIILSIIVLILTPGEGNYVWDGRGYYYIGSLDAYWFACLRTIAFSSGFILPIIYLAPKYTKTIINVVRIIMLIVFIGLFIWLLNLDKTLGWWDIIKLTGHFLCLILGLFISKFFDIED
ncbi:hypothetical protein E4T80_05560 [Muribacter muris]|uniref:Uncharacterized protein n=1 Tax=Muribacter muris TaxID=67855 RepID=A0A4Y9JYB5_9PAST|nr:hypothetical protein [Muribacter muris]MBF0784935.1 hypothetical protein [Muribacter muris]MBF0827243.1 hypothetical protein [Muribacter muris]TFV10854.1 hypothetical protein E4T80_05560 [Muribacter muris]